MFAITTLLHTTLYLTTEDYSVGADIYIESKLGIEHKTSFYILYHEI
jgi:hypothetical protein